MVGVVEFVVNFGEEDEVEVMGFGEIVEKEMVFGVEGSGEGKRGRRGGGGG